MAFDAYPWLLDGTTVDAEVIRRALGTLVGSAGGIVTPGDLTITQNGTPNMSVNVGTGQVWVPGKSTPSTGPYYGRNGASVNVPINAANATNPRIDTIVVQVEDPAYGGSGTPMAPVALAGTPTAGATLTNLTGKASISSTSSCYAPGYVLVSANATTITTADILNVAQPIGFGQPWSTLGLQSDLSLATGYNAPRVRREGDLVRLSGVAQNNSGVTIGNDGVALLSGIPTALAPPTYVALNVPIVGTAGSPSAGGYLLNLVIAANATTIALDGLGVSFPSGFLLSLEGCSYPLT